MNTQHEESSAAWGVPGGLGRCTAYRNTDTRQDSARCCYLGCESTCHQATYTLHTGDVAQSVSLLGFLRRRAITREHIYAPSRLGLDGFSYTAVENKITWLCTPGSYWPPEQGPLSETSNPNSLCPTSCCYTPLHPWPLGCPKLPWQGPWRCCLKATDAAAAAASVNGNRHFQLRHFVDARPTPRQTQPPTELQAVGSDCDSSRPLRQPDAAPTPRGARSPPLCACRIFRTLRATATANRRVEYR